MTAILVINRGTTHLITSLQFKFIHSKTKSVWSSDIASPLFCGCGGSSRTASGAVPKLFFYLSSYAACFAAHRTIFFQITILSSADASEGFMTGTVCRGMVSSWWPMSSKTRQVSPTRGGWLCMHNAQCERWGAERRGVSSRCAGCSLWRFTDWTLNIRIIRWFRVFVEEILHAFTNLQRRSIRKKRINILQLQAWFIQPTLLYYY